jgi:hypothetical protein
MTTPTTFWRLAGVSYVQVRVRARPFLDVVDFFQSRIFFRQRMWWPHRPPALANGHWCGRWIFSGRWKLRTRCRDRCMAVMRKICDKFAFDRVVGTGGGGMLFLMGMTACPLNNNHHPVWILHDGGEKGGEGRNIVCDERNISGHEIISGHEGGGIDDFATSSW